MVKIILCPAGIELESPGWKASALSPRPRDSYLVSYCANIYCCCPADKVIDKRFPYYPHQSPHDLPVVNSLTYCKYQAQ